MYLKKNGKTRIFYVARNKLYASLAVRWCQLLHTICAATAKFIPGEGRGGVLKRVFDELNATTLFKEKGGCTEEMI